MEAAGFNAAVGQQQFLNLLVTQLQYQDPLQPVDQQDFISQLAQFSVLDGVERLNGHFDELVKVQTLSQGAGLVGHLIEYASPSSGGMASGRVEQAQFVDGRLTISVNGEQVAIDSIQAILADPLPQT